jgi:50S ribosomal protein L16 3-hydroxylase
MDVDRPLALLGGLSPATFMRRHWQKKPLLVRGAWPDAQPPVDRSALFALAASDDVESRLVVREGKGWSLRRGPLARRALPPIKQAGWTLLVQGLDLHHPAAHALLNRFRFVPDARLDDLMVSYASDGGGVGAHLDSYDVFLLQVHGRRRWRIGRVDDATLVDGVPLKILAKFEPEHEWLLEPGDMLYLPPRWGHDGVAEGECMTCSIGFRAPSTAGLAQEVLQRVIEAIDLDDAPQLYRDASQPATPKPAQVPVALHAFAQSAIERALRAPALLERALGEVLSEPKPQVWFDGGVALSPDTGVQLDRRTRMMYDAAHVFINGEAFRAGGRDAALMRRLADERTLSAREVARLGDDAMALLDEWARAGWLHGA